MDHTLSIATYWQKNWFMSKKMQNTPQKCDLTIKKALANRKKVVKTGSISMGSRYQTGPLCYFGTPYQMFFSIYRIQWAALGVKFQDLRRFSTGSFHLKWMSKLVVVVKCRFLIILIAKLHLFAFIKLIKILEEIKELSKL